MGVGPGISRGSKIRHMWELRRKEQKARENFFVGGGLKKLVVPLASP